MVGISFHIHIYALFLLYSSISFNLSIKLSVGHLLPHQEGYEETVENKTCLPTLLETKNIQEDTPQIGREEGEVWSPRVEGAQVWLPHSTSSKAVILQRRNGYVTCLDAQAYGKPCKRFLCLKCGTETAESPVTPW